MSEYINRIVRSAKRPWGEASGLSRIARPESVPIVSMSGAEPELTSQAGAGVTGSKARAGVTPNGHNLPLISVRAQPLRDRPPSPTMAASARTASSGLTQKQRRVPDARAPLPAVPSQPPRASSADALDQPSEVDSPPASGERTAVAPAVSLEAKRRRSSTRTGLELARSSQIGPSGLDGARDVAGVTDSQGLDPARVVPAAHLTPGALDARPPHPGALQISDRHSLVAPAIVDLGPLQTAAIAVTPPNHGEASAQRQTTASLHIGTIEMHVIRRQPPPAAPLQPKSVMRRPMPADLLRFRLRP